MIARYVYRISSDEPLPAGRAYAFYSCLLSALPGEIAERLHEQSETPVAQCIYRERADMFWQIHLLDGPTEEAFAPVLDELTVLPLNSGDVELELREKETIDAEKLIEAARSLGSDRSFFVRFLSPTAFKQSGRYNVLPDKELILQSLIKKWNIVFPAYPLEDDDAFRMLVDGVRVADHDIRTTRYPLKDNKIPGFIGNVRFETQLSAPLLEVWKILITFAAYSGVGIKTALGMGGVKHCTRY